MTKNPAPNGYFNATKRLKDTTTNTNIKVSQFLDNANVSTILTTLHPDKPLLSAGGRYGYTFLPTELLDSFESWLLFVNIKSKIM